MKTTVLARFPQENKVPLINGWDFELSNYQWAWNYGELLTASIETSNICNLACEYCFREEQKIVSKKRLPNELSLDESLKLIDDLAHLGVQTINIAGAGEPLMDNHLIPMLKKIAQYDITPLVATNGSLIDDKWVDLFEKTNSSVMVKVNSFNEEKQNYLVHRRNYAKRRDEGLRKLIEAGFNKPNENYQTKLSINALVSKETINEIPQIFNYCRENNIMPCMETFIPAGKTANKTTNRVEKDEFYKVADKLRLEDKERGIEYIRLWPYLGGVPCTQQGKASIFVNIKGEIYDCPAGTKPYGDIKSTTIKKAFQQIKQQEKNYCLGCPVRDKYN